MWKDKAQQILVQDGFACKDSFLVSHKLYNLCCMGWVLVFVSTLPNSRGSVSRRMMLMDKVVNSKG